MADDIKNENEGEEAQLSAADPQDLEAKLEKCEIERNEYLNGWQRTKADFQNYRKGEMERLREAVSFAGEDLVREMISIMDSFDLGLMSLEKLGPVDRGIYMIRAQIEDVLKKKGLSRIAVEPGTVPDHAYVEAMAEVESEFPAGAIVTEIEPGYILNNKVIRAARVTVSKGKGSA
jgi:molecular chaperone GrpE